MSPVRLDRFQPVRERDRWGLGECVDALDTEHRDAPVVLKRLGPVTAEQHARVATAVRSLERLRHNTIVPVEGYGFDGDVPFLVLEPAEGQSLRAWIDEHNAALRWPDLAEVRALFDGVCAAVAVAHRMRALAGTPVLHGLLSPESVLISRAAGSGSWDVSVMDFALSTLPGVVWSPSPTSLMSDPRAPEQLADVEAVSTASDVFSLGVLLASMLVPFAFPVRPKCWAHSVEEQPGAVRALLVAMRADVPAALYDELVKALALDPRQRHADADRLRTALRRVPWEPVAELAPPPRFVEAAEPRARESHDDHSRPMMRMPAALLADLGPSPMNLRASVPTQMMFNKGVARTDLFAPAPEEPTDAAFALDPPAEDTLSARSFETPSATTSVDALLAFRHFAREGTLDAHDEPAPAAAADEPVDEPTGPVALVPAAEPTDDLLLPGDELPATRTDPPPGAELVVPADDLFSGEYAAQETVVRRPPPRPKRASLREATQTLTVARTTFGERPAEGMLVAGVKLQALVLKAPPRPPERHEGTRVRVLAPSGELLPVETPADPWGDGTVPEAPAPSPPAPSPPAPSPPAPSLPAWSVQARLPTMAPPSPWRDLSRAPSPDAWIESPPTVRMTLPPPAPSAPPAPRASSLRVLLIAVAVVGVLAFALGVLAGR